MIRKTSLTAYAVLAVVAVLATWAGFINPVELVSAGGLALAGAAGVIVAGSDRVEEIRARLVEISDSVKAVQDKADAEKRNLTQEEVDAIEASMAEFDELEAELQRRQRADAIAARAAAGTGRVTDPNKPGTSVPQARTRQPDGLQHTTLRTREEKDRWGFNNLGDFAQSVRNWLGGKQDPRLITNAALSTYSSEGVGADGGFAVPPEFRAQIQSLVFSEDQLLARCDAMPTDSNLVIVPTDENTDHATSGGIQVYRRAEAATMTQSKLALKEITVRVEELYALVPVTDQLLADAPMLGRFLTDKAATKINFRVNDEIVNGTGAAGQMLGLLNAGATVTVSKESGQAANTVVAANILKMYARMPAAMRRNAVWLINQDVEQQIYQLFVQGKSDAGGGVAAGFRMPTVQLPGENGADDLRLMGKPVIATEACPALSSKGDIVLAHLPSYFIPYRTGGIREAMSMHLWFDQGMTAFRWTFRAGGQPWHSAPISRKNGSNTLAPFVTLEAR